MKRRSLLLAGIVLPWSGRTIFAQPSEARPALVLKARDFLRLDGSEEDDKLAALVQEITRVRRPVTVDFGSTDGTLSLSGRRAFALPASVRWDFGRIRLQTRAQLGSNSALLAFGEHSQVLGLRVDLLPGSQAQRLIVLRDDSVIERMQVSAAQQLKVGDGDNVDGLLQVRGSRVQIRDVAFSGIDKPVMVMGSGAVPGRTQHLESVTIEGLRLTSYVTGIHIRNVRGCVLRGLTASTRSPHAAQNPGHNALLAGHVQDFLLDDFRIEDAGEHAIRFGGSSNEDELANRGLTVSRGKILRAGKCGLKVWAGGKFQDRERGVTSDITVRDVRAWDLGSGKLGVNENLIHLEAVRGFHLTDVAAATERASLSCHDGLFLAGASEGRIEGLQVKDCARSAIWITDTVAKNDVWPVRDIVAKDVTIQGARGDAIHLDLSRGASGRLAFSSVKVEGAQRGLAGIVGGNKRDLDLQLEGDAQQLKGQPVDLQGSVQVKGGWRRSR